MFPTSMEIPGWRQVDKTGCEWEAVSTAGQSGMNAGHPEAQVPCSPTYPCVDVSGWPHPGRRRMQSTRSSKMGCQYGR